MEKLADNLQKLGEDDLLHVVEMVHNNKTADTYTKNDVERKSEIPPVLSLDSFALSTRAESERERERKKNTFR